MARTPSSEAHEKVLSAAGELIAKHGVNGFTMDSIARTSGVSKATIYKHWPDKEALCLETAKRLAGVIPSFGSESPGRIWSLCCNIWPEGKRRRPGARSGRV